MRLKNLNVKIVVKSARGIYTTDTRETYGNVIVALPYIIIKLGRL